jgi:hypothetical protein
MHRKDDYHNSHKLMMIPNQIKNPEEEEEEEGEEAAAAV